MFAKKMFFNKKVVRGFTLVEIVVVLVILAILVATAIPSLIGFVDDAKKKSLANEVRAVYTAAQAYATEHFGNGDLDDDQIKNAICGLINSEHSLYYLLQKDATGTVLDADVENGKVKSIKYTKDSINNLEADYFIDDNVQFVKLDTDTGAIVNASSAVTNINIDDLKAEIKADLINSVYPIGALYTSYDSTSPETLFGGKWTQITDRFLYCADSAGTTGGSKKIAVGQLPAHNHTGSTSKSSGFKLRNDVDINDTTPEETNDKQSYNVQPGAWYLWGNYNSGAAGVYRKGFNGFPGDNNGNIEHSHTFTTGNTGSGEDYMPPYTTVYCWRRTE